MAEPFVEIHPRDANKLNVKPADLVQLTSPTGMAILRARITDTVQLGQVFAPMHWTGETAPSARIDALVAAACDPISGQPESKASVVAARRYEAAWYGFAVSHHPMALTSDYWALARTPQGYRAEMAGSESIGDWVSEARRLFGRSEAEVSSIIDTNRGTARIVLHENALIIGALFVSRQPVAVVRDYLASLPGTKSTDALIGRPGADVPNPGPVLCSCFGVGVNTILTAIETRGLMSVESIGEALGAGTNCGSCRPEITELLARLRMPEAAE